MWLISDHAIHLLLHILNRQNPAVRSVENARSQAKAKHEGKHLFPLLGQRLQNHSRLPLTLPRTPQMDPHLAVVLDNQLQALLVQYFYDLPLYLQAIILLLWLLLHLPIILLVVAIALGPAPPLPQQPPLQPPQPFPNGPPILPHLIRLRARQRPRRAG